jgi:hypothetical protein
MCDFHEVSKKRSIENLAEYDAQVKRQNQTIKVVLIAAAAVLVIGCVVLSAFH